MRTMSDVWREPIVNESVTSISAHAASKAIGIAPPSASGNTSRMRNVMSWATPTVAINSTTREESNNRRTTSNSVTRPMSAAPAMPSAAATGNGRSYRWNSTTNAATPNVPIEAWRS